MQLWAAIDLMGGSAVTLVQGRAEERTVWRDTPLQLARRWQEEGADGLHLVDLDSAFGAGSNAETARRIIKQASVPVQVGGGIRSVRAAREWLEDGATRIVVGTLAFSDPKAAQGLIETHGTDRIVVAADYKGDTIVTRGWSESQGIGVLAGAKRLEEQGFRNLLATSVGRDGTGSGPDLSTVRELSSATKMKIIASGGIRDSSDLIGLKRAGAEAAIIGRALYEERIRLAEAKERLG